MLAQAVPQSWFIYMIAVAILLFIIRIIFRVLFFLQDRKKGIGGNLRSLKTNQRKAKCESTDS